MSGCCGLFETDEQAVLHALHQTVARIMSGPAGERTLLAIHGALSNFHHDSPDSRQIATMRTFRLAADTRRAVIGVLLWPAVNVANGLAPGEIQRLVRSYVDESSTGAAGRVVLLDAPEGAAHR